MCKEYENWYSWPKGYLGIQQSHLHFLQFLAENPESSIYDLSTKFKVHEKRGEKETYSLSYSRKILLELEKLGFALSRYDRSGPRIRRCFRLTGKGLMLFIVSRDEHARERRYSIRKTVKNYPHFFLFSKYWDDFLKIINEDKLVEKLAQTSRELLHGRYIDITIDDLPMSFRAYFYQFSGRFHIKSEVKIKGKKRNNSFSDFLASNELLRKSYIAFLALHDIWDLADGTLDVNMPESLRSERELSYFENKKLTENRLFTTNRLRYYFPKYAEMQYVFTGNLMFKLMWETEKPLITKSSRFHIKW